MMVGGGTPKIFLRPGCLVFNTPCCFALQSRSMGTLCHWLGKAKKSVFVTFNTSADTIVSCSFESEAVPGTIPRGQNSPRCVRFGLYAEQMTASAFVAPRHLNKNAWLYRSRPAVAHQGFVRLSQLETTILRPFQFKPGKHRRLTHLDQTDQLA